MFGIRELEYNKRFTISSDMQGLKQCLENACDIQKRFNFEPDIEFAFETVLMEAVSNAICHGNKFNENLTATVNISISDEHINIVVEDQGEGFDLDKIPSPTDKANINLEDGRGIFFIKKLSSSIRTIGKGNIIEIIIDR